MTHLLLMRPLWSKRGEKTLDGTFWVGRDRQDPSGWEETDKTLSRKSNSNLGTVLYSSLYFSGRS